MCDLSAHIMRAWSANTLQVALSSIRNDPKHNISYKIACLPREDSTPASILYKSIAGRYRPVIYPDGPITARYRFIKNAYWDIVWAVTTQAPYNDAS